MKSERRHELQHNELALWLIKTGEAIKPYQNHIFAVVLIGLAAYVGYAWWTRSSTEQNVKACNELIAGIETGDLSELTKVTENYPETQAARTAAVVAGDIHLINGCNQLFENKALGEQHLSKAILKYETDLRLGRNPMLLARATFGLARAKEAKGELEEAERRYGEVVANWPKCAYAPMAKQRLEDLKRPEMKKMYDDFRAFDPTPVIPGEFDVPGKRPGFDMKDVPKEKPTEFSGLGSNPEQEKKEEPKKQP